MRSSCVDRTVVTAQNMLTGLYPTEVRSDEEGKKWIPAPVPIQIVSTQDDYVQLNAVKQKIFLGYYFFYFHIQILKI